MVVDSQTIVAPSLWQIRYSHDGMNFISLRTDSGLDENYVASLWARENILIAHGYETQLSLHNDHCAFLVMKAPMRENIWP